ncbi:5-oxoprolinase subunit C family protein [Pseudoalteromonas sp. S16_S37]|uniref:5-oxoprolinase subunit C family protein n=1 Tax=Pseudoalteromonas sp. S16_S37 TaxID=2720228 RepID=UPI00168150E8|nr:biotin-dependent carboxyltransferase family protein [Pseudoalteromonas sp. S16_S37]MBD1583215.1 biotin-dependent carboxyltransferase family protein [Pseudoalteromonas sp. S16_S37]
MLKVIKQGVMASIQDIGRFGYRHYGVCRSGALDPFAVCLANMLLDNPPHHAVIEITIGLAEFEFTQPCNFALTGGCLNAKLAGRSVYPGWRYYAHAGDRLTFATSAIAQRAYFAVQGSFALEPTLSSCSTDLQAGFGGHQGRALQSGDCLNYEPSPSALKPLGVKQPEYKKQVRVLKGPHCDKLPAGSFEQLVNGPWTISEASNRMGSRLNSKALLSHDVSIATQAVHPGVIQIPPSGEPIVLLNDCQTTGGYPIVATVIDADLRMFSQLSANQQCNFVECDLIQARKASDKLSAHLAQFRLAKNNN